MKTLKLCMVVGLMLGISSAAWAKSLPPLPGTGSTSINATGAYAEIFGPNGGNGTGIGWVTPSVSGSPEFVLYSGYQANVGGAPTESPTVVSNDISNLVGGQLYVGGVVENISNASGTLTYARDPNDLGNTGWQISFGLYDAEISALDTSMESGGILRTTFTVETDTPHLDFWADPTPDATLGAVTGVSGQRYQTSTNSQDTELPVRDDDAAGTLMVDLDTGQYYDQTTGGDWGELAFAGDPSDDDYVLWSFTGNPNATLQIQETWNTVDSFQFDVDGDGTLDTVYVGGESRIRFVDNPQFVPGASAVTDAIVGRDVVRADGTGFGNHLLTGAYNISGLFVWGESKVGAFDSDPRTWTFQQGWPLGPDGGAVGSQTLLAGQIIPEPLTVLGVVGGIAGLGGYIRKRRMA